MPLSSRINKSEPKKKRAKTERKSPTPVSSASSTRTSRLKAKEKKAQNLDNSTRSSSSLSSAENDEPLVNAISKTSLASSNGKLSKKEERENLKSETKKPLKINNEQVTAKNKIETTKANGKKAVVAAEPVVVEQANTTAMNCAEDTMITDVSQAAEACSAKVSELSQNFVRNDKPGLVLAVGENLSNQLGLGGDVNDRKKPQVVKELPENVIQIASGGMHSACLTQDGIVYTFGCNDEYALGRDNDDEIDKVELPEKIIEITAGDSHTAALSDTGIVYAWGTFRDGSGVLGLEQKKIAKKPMKFKLKDRILKISSGADHLVFLAITGEVYTAGNSEHGQLGRVSKYNSCRGGRRGYDMILVPGLVRFAKRKELQGHRQIEDIWTSAYCTFLKVKESDLIIGFGLNNCFQLGIEDCENRYQPEILHSLKFEGKLNKAIGGMHHTIFLDSKGFVYTMGSHRYGSLGLGKIEADVKEPTRVPDLKDIIDIAANTNVSYAIDKKGKAFSWGTNYSKQLGLDTEDDYLTPTLVNSKQLDVRDVHTVSVGGQHSLFVVSEEKDEDSDSD